ncbi:copper metallochaperone, Cox17 [Streptomyces sp. L-9-10]|uniref:copper chaperone PCu(A)C n=1 Tax=Streptomyces sp. L-9-10 TaxID=1478131 RepID=UPI00101C2869|nr:copper chaperone PCu(A)C [Streptomyces sp. L-9-10]RYJ30413.1 copper metallochaperone, Cox17 [Streptomyces sp. L-9-10]
MNRRTLPALAVALTAALALAGCSSASSASSSSSSSASGSSSGSSANPSGNTPQLKVSGGYMPRPVGDLAAGFLVVTNSGGAADKLTSVTSDISDDITIHSTENQKMRKVKFFDIPAGGELNLARGGNHIMFMGLTRQPKEGQKVSIELHFEKADPIKVELPVKEINYNPAQR